MYWVCKNFYPEIIKILGQVNGHPSSEISDTVILGHTLNLRKNARSMQFALSKVICMKKDKKRLRSSVMVMSLRTISCHCLQYSITIIILTSHKVLLYWFLRKAFIIAALGGESHNISSSGLNLTISFSKPLYIGSTSSSVSSEFTLLYCWECMYVCMFVTFPGKKIDFSMCDFSRKIPVFTFYILNETFLVKKCDFWICDFSRSIPVLQF